MGHADMKNRTEAGTGQKDFVFLFFSCLVDRLIGWQEKGSAGREGFVSLSPTLFFLEGSFLVFFFCTFSVLFCLFFWAASWALREQWAALQSSWLAGSLLSSLFAARVCLVG